jgi:hypothetical protein
VQAAVTSRPFWRKDEMKALLWMTYNMEIAKADDRIHKMKDKELRSMHSCQTNSPDCGSGASQ